MSGHPGTALDERGMPRGATVDPAWEVTPRETRRILAEPGGRTLLLDCRRPDEHATARIEGALLAPLGDLPRLLEDLREHEDRPIIVYCHHGRRSLQAASILRQAGFRDVKSMAGGIDLWSLAVDPDVPRY